MTEDLKQPLNLMDYIVFNGQYAVVIAIIVKYLRIPDESSRFNLCSEMKSVIALYICKLHALIPGILSIIR